MDFHEIVKIVGLAPPSLAPLDSAVTTPNFSYFHASQTRLSVPSHLFSHLYTLRMNRASDTCGKAMAANGRGMARPDFRLSQALCVRKSVTYRSAHSPDYQKEPAKRDYMRSWKAVRAWAQPRAVTDCSLFANRWLSAMRRSEARICIQLMSWDKAR